MSDFHTDKQETRRLCAETLSLSGLRPGWPCGLHIANAAKGQSPRGFPVGSSLTTGHRPALPAVFQQGTTRLSVRIGMGGKRAGEMYGSDRTARPQGIWLSSSDSFELSQEFLCSMRIQPTLKCKHSKKAGIPFHKTLLMELSTVFMKNRNICIWQSMS